MENMFPFILEGAWTAVQLAFFTLVFALPLGMIVAMGRLSRFKVVAWIARIYQVVLRGTPLMLQLVLVYYGPTYILGLKWDRFIAAVVAFSLNYAAYFGEIYRAGIQSIPRGQYEAASVLGMSRRKTFFRIILPQVIKRILPPCCNEIMTLVKDTALAMTIAIPEIMRNANTVAAREFSVIPWLVALAVYLIINIVVEQVFHLSEKRLQYYK